MKFLFPLFLAIGLTAGIAGHVTTAEARDCNAIAFDMNNAVSSFTRAGNNLEAANAEIAFAQKRKNDGVLRMATAKADVYASSVVGSSTEIIALAEEMKRAGGCGLEAEKLDGMIAKYRDIIKLIEGGK